MNQFPPPDDDQMTRPRPQVPRPSPDQFPTVQSDRTRQHRMPSRQPPPPQFDEEEPEPETSALYVPWWAFVLVILVVAGLTCGLWGVVLMTRGNASTGSDPTPTPIIVVITASPTLGPAPDDTDGTPPPSGATSTPGQVDTGPTPTVAAVEGIAIGKTVIIFGTGGDGLSVRQGPGREYALIFVAADGDTFEVQDGPREADGYVWWYIVDPTNPDRFGWAVSDFIQVAP